MKTNISNSVKNPLAVVAIFAGISEVAMSITLIQLPEDCQKIFIWFVMLFPALLVVIFFFILYTKPAVLFSPSDYKEDETYISSIRRANNMTEVDRRLKRLEEVTLTLQTYMEKVVTEISPESSAEIISEQQKRLDFIRQIYNMESNHLYSFLNREVDLSPDTIIEMISKAEDIQNLGELVLEKTKSNSMKERVERIIQRFPRVRNDFDQLKKGLGA